MFNTSNLYQNDPKWKDVALGNQTKETIGSWGCLLTSITMMLNGIGYSETPDTVNDKLKKAGGFDGALTIPASVPYAFPNLVYKNCQACENSPAPIKDIDSWLEEDKPVIVQVDWNKASGIQTHWVLLKEKKGDDYVMYDPYKYSGDSPSKELLLTSRYKYQGGKIENEISFVFWFDTLGNPAPPPEKPKVTPPSNALKVFAIEDDLALRGDPNVAGYLYKRLAAGTQLTCLEASAAAKAKVGVQNQWLQVQDESGQQGYVAAWYTGLQWPLPVAPSGGTQPAETGTMILVPTMEGLALRKQPVVSDATLIKRLPLASELTALDPISDVIKKAGVQNQWLKVKDASGSEGYVAAWYVTRKGGTSTTPAPTPPAAPTSGPLKVKTITNLVALRKQPVVSDATLVKRLNLGAVLTVVEGSASQVGVTNQWLKVKDPAGVEGYVAAWFVAL